MNAFSRGFGKNAGHHHAVVNHMLEFEIKTLNFARRSHSHGRVLQNIFTTREFRPDTRSVRCCYEELLRWNGEIGKRWPVNEHWGRDLPELGQF